MPLGALDVLCQCGEVRRPQDVAALLAKQVASTSARDTFDFRIGSIGSPITLKWSHVPLTTTATNITYSYDES
jgi:hypothetical protein